jgi:hypothetical protein
MKAVSEKKIKGMNLYRLKKACIEADLEVGSKEEMVEALLEHHGHSEKAAPKKKGKASKKEETKSTKKASKKKASKKSSKDSDDSGDLEAKVEDLAKQLAEVKAELKEHQKVSEEAINKLVEVVMEDEDDEDEDSSKEDSDSSEGDGEDDDDDGDSETEEETEAAKKVLKKYISDDELEITPEAVKKLKRDELHALATLLELDPEELPGSLPKTKKLLAEKLQEMVDDDEDGDDDGDDDKYTAEAISSDDGLNAKFWKKGNKNRKVWICLGDDGDNEWLEAETKKVGKDEDGDIVLFVKFDDGDPGEINSFSRDEATIDGEVYMYCGGFVVE